MERQKDKILIVDDVELNRAILCELFAGDYEILEADNGRTAVDLMEQYHEEIAIVLMDIVMPIMDGLEALEIMNGKGLTEKTPIFLITAESSNDAISKGFRLGVVDVVLKPFNPDNICQRVNNIIELYRYRYKLEKLVQEQMTKIEKQNEQLRNFNVAMIDTLSTIVEFRDCESGQHVQRIRQLTKIMLKELVDEQGMACLFVTHDMDEAFVVARRVVVMRGGRVMADIDRDTPHFNSEDIMKAAWGGELD